MARQQRNGGSSPQLDNDEEDGAHASSLAPPASPPMNLDDAPDAAAIRGDGRRTLTESRTVGKHHCRMVQASGGGGDNPKVYYKCKVRGCEAKANVIRTDDPRVVPKEPQLCPRCSSKKGGVICERDTRVSTPAMVILQCPVCGWKSTGLASPSLAAAHFARGGRKLQETVEEIGAR
jgi:hypothetical protein